MNLNILTMLNSILFPFKSFKDKTLYNDKEVLAFKTVKALNESDYLYYK